MKAQLVAALPKCALFMALAAVYAAQNQGFLTPDQGGALLLFLGTGGGSVLHNMQPPKKDGAS